MRDPTAFIAGDIDRFGLRDLLWGEREGLVLGLKLTRLWLNLLSEGTAVAGRLMLLDCDSLVGEAEAWW